MGQLQANPDVPPAVSAWTRIRRTHSSTTLLLGRELQARHGLSLNDYEALSTLSRADGQRMKRVDLARNLLLSPSGVTRLLEGLQDAHLVERTGDASDLRITYAQLTDAGAATLEAASHAHVSVIRALLEARLSDAEIVQLGELLERLQDLELLDGDIPQRMSTLRSRRIASHQHAAIITAR
jgi:DNA-binding MarR family transcriptional regulator